MTRITQITERSQVDSDKQHVFDSIATSRGRVSGPFSVLLNSPEVAGRAAHLGSYIRFESTLTPSQRELAIITTAREFDCAYEWAAHATLAQEAGVREAAIETIAIMAISVISPRMRRSSWPMDARFCETIGFPMARLPQQKLSLANRESPNSLPQSATMACLRAP